MTSVRSVREGVSPRGGHRLRTATADCLGPTAAPAPRPTQPPQGAPTAAPSTAPTARPTTAPSSEPTTAAPSAAPTELCETTTYRSGVAISVPARRRPSSMTFAALARGRSTWQPPRRRERSTEYPTGPHGVAANGRRDIQLAPTASPRAVDGISNWRRTAGSCAIAATPNERRTLRYAAVGSCSGPACAFDATFDWSENVADPRCVATRAGVKSSCDVYSGRGRPAEAQRRRGEVSRGGRRRVAQRPDGDASRRGRSGTRRGRGRATAATRIARVR